MERIKTTFSIQEQLPISVLKSKAYLEPSQTSAVEFFCENKTVKNR